MKATFFLLIITFIVRYSLAQTTTNEKIEEATKSFARGEYEKSIKLFKILKLEFPDKVNEFAEYIYRCEACISYQEKAEAFVIEEDYNSAIETLNKILAINYTDKNANDLINSCRAHLRPRNTMIYVQGGKFWQGNENEEEKERPIREVTIKSFFIDRYEVTNFEYCTFLNDNRYSDSIGIWIKLEGKSRIEFINNWYRPVEGYENYPVINVSWHGAKGYARWAKKDLPTESEWEYAARGGIYSKNYTYSGSNYSDSVAFYKNNSNGNLQEVGRKQSNELGLYDMSGNASEWCDDNFIEYYYFIYPEFNLDDASSPDKNVRGGNTYAFEKNITNTYRNYLPPNLFFYAVGFRCIKRIY